MIVRPYVLKRWIACALSFRGIRRRVMTPRRYTELFFLDEAVAFSAGHRPCAECRRADFKRFQTLWVELFNGPAGADAMDARLHVERLDGGKKRTYRAGVTTLPNGVLIVRDGAPHLVWARHLLQWSDSGYVARCRRPTRGDAEVLTPRSTVAILASGYRPAIHPSAE